MNWKKSSKIAYVIKISTCFCSKKYVQKNGSNHRRIQGRARYKKIKLTLPFSPHKLLFEWIGFILLLLYKSSIAITCQRWHANWFWVPRIQHPVPPSLRLEKHYRDGCGKNPPNQRTHWVVFCSCLTSMYNLRVEHM